MASDIGGNLFQSPQTQHALATAQLVQREAARYGVPLGFALSLVQAESGGDPNAENSGHIGLLQIGPDYPGAAGKNLRDPQTNLDIGFSQLGRVYQQEGSPPDTLQNYEELISHTGFAVWTGWKNEPSDYQKNYISTYNAVHQGSGGLAGLGVTPGTPVLGGVSTATGNAGLAIGAATSFAANPLGWAQQQGWKLLIIVIALVLLIASAMKIIGVNPSDVAKAAPMAAAA